jgi:hypothetical protein
VPEAGKKQQLSEPRTPIATHEHLQVTPAAVMSDFGNMCIAMSASGAVVAIRDLAGMRCTVSFGNAPAVGSRLATDSVFISQCVETGEVVLCEDAESDSRMDPSVATHFAFHSAVAVPVQVQETVVGLIEVFCSEPSAISPTAIAGLQKVAKSFASLMIFDAAYGGPSLVGGALESPIVLPTPIVEQKPTTVANPGAKTIAHAEKRAIPRTAPATLQLPSDKPTPARVWLIAAALLVGLSLLFLFLFRATYRI